MIIWQINDSIKNGNKLYENSFQSVVRLGRYREDNSLVYLRDINEAIPSMAKDIVSHFVHYAFIVRIDNTIQETYNDKYERVKNYEYFMNNLSLSIFVERFNWYSTGGTNLDISEGNYILLNYRFGLDGHHEISFGKYGCISNIYKSNDELEFNPMYESTNTPNVYILGFHENLLMFENRYYYLHFSPGIYYHVYSTSLKMRERLDSPIQSGDQWLYYNNENKISFYPVPVVLDAKFRIGLKWFLGLFLDIGGYFKYTFNTPYKDNQEFGISVGAGISTSFDYSFNSPFEKTTTINKIWFERKEPQKRFSN